MTPAENEKKRQELLVKLGANPRLAHEALFSHRHSVESPEFHLDIIDLMHDPYPKGVVEGFRSSAKSTRAEEAIVIKALFKRHTYILIVGASHPRAKERLGAIKNELTTNRSIEYLFGKQEGETWGESKIILTNGVCIEAMGSGMSMRGMRYLNDRPQFALIDDLEDEESVKSPEQRAKTLTWLTGTFLPALSEHPRAVVRMLGNRLDSDALIVKVAKDPAWKHIRIPVMEQAEDGEVNYGLPPGRWRPTWKAMFPLQRIAEKRDEYLRLGRLQTFDCEYMCEADNPESKIFKPEHQRTHAGVRTWEAVYAAYDPARTVGSTSATTGVAVFSWVGNRLIVWKGYANLWLPDQIVEDIFRVDDEFHPVVTGVEATGLEEFIMQPLRHKALERRALLPLQRLIPPRGKDSFIASLQPFFKAGQIEFADVSAEARGQLLAFPTGRKDFPNALAYAMMMRPGLPIYGEFGREHVQVELWKAKESWYLAANATNQFTTAVLLQVVGGQFRIHADWIMEGPPSEVIKDVVGQANLGIDGGLSIVVPPEPPGRHDTVGLRVALRANQLSFTAGGAILKGRETVRDYLARRKRDEPLLVIAGDRARWTLNAMSSGFARAVDKRGQLSDEPIDGPYRVLIEGFEAFAARYSTGAVESMSEGARYAVDPKGNRYKTILPVAQEREQELKRPYG